MNKVILTGRLVRDNTVNVGNSGTSILRNSIAVDRKFKRDGEPSADFIGLMAFGKTAEFIEKYFSKGKPITIEGRIQTGSYEKDGQKHYTTDVIVENVEFAISTGQGNTSNNAGNDGFINVLEEIDEEVPFI